MKASHFFWTSISNEGKPNLARHGKQKKPADFRSPLHASAPEAESGIDGTWSLTVRKGKLSLVGIIKYHLELELRCELSHALNTVNLY